MPSGRSVGSIAEMFERQTAWQSGDDVVLLVGGRTLAIPRGRAKRPDDLRAELMKRNIGPEVALAIVPETLTDKRLGEICGNA